MTPKETTQWAVECRIPAVKEVAAEDVVYGRSEHRWLVPLCLSRYLQTHRRHPKPPYCQLYSYHRQLLDPEDLWVLLSTVLRTSLHPPPVDKRKKKFVECDSIFRGKKNLISNYLTYTNKYFLSKKSDIFILWSIYM